MPRQAVAASQRSWMLSPFALPLHALRIVGTCALPLIIWYAVCRALRFGLLLSAATLSHGSWYQARLVVVMFLFTLVVLLSLATTVGMLHAVRPALMESRARRADGSSQEGILGAFNRCALVFSALYLTWGFHIEDVREFTNIDLFRQPDVFLVDAFAGRQSTAMTGLIGLDVKVSLATMIVAYVVKTVFGRRHETGKGRFSGILATFGELAFVFYGLNATVTLIRTRGDWAGGRVAVVGWQNLVERWDTVIPGWPAFREALSEIWPYVIDGLAIPLAWLTVGILVYGAYAEDTQTTIRGTRLEALQTHYERTHSLTQRLMNKLTAGWTGRWIPLLNSLRLTVRGGAPLFGLFALCYVAVQIAGQYIGRAGHYLLASDEPYFWFVTGVPIDFVTDLVVTMLSIGLIAATFDLAATRSRGKGVTQRVNRST